MITIEKLSKVYNQGMPDEVRALDEICLTINDGELVAIVGASGAGKSTLMHIICGADKATDGIVAVNGCNISSLNDKALSEYRSKKVGTVFQDFALINELTVYENVELPLIFSNMKSKERKNKVQDALEKMKIGNLGKRKITQLSGGQKQRTAIARAIANDPLVVLADEPTGALDSKTGNIIFSCFKEINEMGKTVIIITHNNNISQRCDRLIQLKDGRIV
ncbi:MAG: ABC transporter ATP-binding protein YtrE [Firmicutes bacterium ADurb.Bin300]|nr:MAG: ABC transporter ATP-binding protein YtrE [Firmicutes bacterium ADurb.Bin300]